MTAESPALVRTFRVGRRTVTLTVPRPVQGGVAIMVMEWAPTVPSGLSRKERRQYRAGRDAAIAELAKTLGLRVIVADL